MASIFGPFEDNPMEGSPGTPNKHSNNPPGLNDAELENDEALREASADNFVTQNLVPPKQTLESSPLLDEASPKLSQPMIDSPDGPRASIDRVVGRPEDDNDTIKEEETEEVIWENFPDEIITISDDEADPLSNIPSGAQETSVLPKSRRNVPLRKKGGPRTPISPEQKAKFIEFQRVLAARSLGIPVASEADGIFQEPGNIRSGRPDVPTDSNAWMHETADNEEDAAAVFARLKRRHNAKKKAGSNNWEDDIHFIKAQRAEKARLKGIENEARKSTLQQQELRQSGGDDDGDGNEEEDDDGLFVPEIVPQGPPRKRTHATVESGNEARINGQNDENPSKRTKSSLQSKKQSEKQDFADALLAGIEAETAKHEKQNKKKNKKQNPSASKSAGASTSTKAKREKAGKPSSKTEKKPKEKKARAKAPKPTLFRDVDSLLSSNVYVDANANLDKADAPLMTGKRKEDALKQLVASVPLEDKRMASKEKQHILKATRTLGHYRVRAGDDGNWIVKGMKSTLPHFQIQGSAWMVERETGEDEPLGGMLCDSMGFGKTIMLICLMVARRPPEDTLPRTTLIVATPALVTQWEEELGKHAERDATGDIIRYHAGSRIGGPGVLSMLTKAHVVLTTYSELQRSYPKFNPPKELVTYESKSAWWKEHFETKRGPLHRMRFHRVILDEAQVIKNHLSQTSKACRGLQAVHRWAVSGTPISNSTSELFSFFKFLRVPHTGNFEVFCENFCDKSSVIGNERLHTFLKRFMMRRVYTDTLFGAPLVKLPKNHERTITVEFSSVERAIYEIVRARYIQRINSFQQRGILEKSYNNVLTMLLRLRQLTGHTFMLQETMEDLFELEDVERLWEATAHEVTSATDEISAQNRDMLNVMREMISTKDKPSDDLEAQGDGGEVDEDQKDDPISEQSRPLVFKFRRLLRELSKSSKWDALRERSLCHCCSDIPNEPYVTSCLHLYCKECLNGMAMDAASKDQDHAACRECGNLYTETHPCNGLKELGQEASSISSQETPERNVKKPKVRKDDMKWIEMDGYVLPSAKTAALVAQIEQWVKEDSKSKIIIFTQFHMMIKIIGRMCMQRGWGHCNYHGQMSLEARDKALRNFRDMAEKKILVASLKCGGVGLNLTMASRVICIDLWWNSAVEQQAFCRVFRIGQTEETKIVRFVVRNTVDDKLQSLQLDKKANIDAAMGDDGTREAKLSLSELLRLFGPVREDAMHKEFIIVDDEEEYDAMPQDRNTDENGESA
ncbi:hypothetical protein MMC13_006293 [Lambiella insularis]|nr:hypothetical protein [Lambiella insularis]